MDHLQISKGQEFNEFYARLPEWQGWLASLLIDADGNTVGPDGTSKSISNSIDLQLLLALRSKSELIVTTGKTARAENYRASRFAPLAFITRKLETLEHLPAIREPGSHKNIFLKPNSTELDFDDLGQQLNELGFSTMLFEGGASSLGRMVITASHSQLVLTISNFGSIGPDDLKPMLAKVLPRTDTAELQDAFVAGPNLVSRWGFNAA